GAGRRAATGSRIAARSCAGSGLAIALSAASSARRVSSAPARGTRPTTSPEYGERTSIQSPVSIQSPPTRSRFSIVVTAIALSVANYRREHDRNPVRPERRREHRVPGRGGRPHRPRLGHGLGLEHRLLLAGAVVRAIPSAARLVLAPHPVRQTGNRDVRPRPDRCPADPGA